MNPNREAIDRIRLLHIVDGLKAGGAELLITHIIKALGTKHYKHYAYYFADDGPVRERLKAFGVPVYKGKTRASIKQPIRFGATLFDQMQELISLIRRKRVQVIQSHMGPANQLAVAVGKLSGIPVLLTVHTPAAFVDKRSPWDMRVYYNKAVNQFVYRAADRILVVSQEIKEIIQQNFGIKDNKLLLLKNGIVCDDNASNTLDFQKEFPCSANKLKIFAAGRLVSLKSFDILVRTIGEVINQGLNDLLLLIAGEGEERMRLEKLIQDLQMGDCVKLLGLRHDVMALMNASDIFVMPSRYEGVSLAMIEAMACGLPIIASDARGLKDCIMNEQNGLLFPVGDHKALAKCILRLANNKELRGRLSLGARKSFETEYDMRKNVKPLDMLFRKYATMRTMR
jgi:glycosyltransferase involved in cell wall biosynthesis